jgi:hypothetical protein
MRQRLEGAGDPDQGGREITAFLDHIEECERCGLAKRALVDELNQAIGGEKED